MTGVTKESKSFDLRHMTLGIGIAVLAAAVLVVAPDQDERVAPTVLAPLTSDNAPAPAPLSPEPEQLLRPEEPYPILSPHAETAELPPGPIEEHSHEEQLEASTPVVAIDREIGRLVETDPGGTKRILNPATGEPAHLGSYESFMMLEGEFWGVNGGSSELIQFIHPALPLVHDGFRVRLADAAGEPISEVFHDIIYRADLGFPEAIVGGEQYLLHPETGSKLSESPSHQFILTPGSKPGWLSIQGRVGAAPYEVIVEDCFPDPGAER